MRNSIFLATVVCCWMIGAPVEAQEWASKMFESTEHDFGVVARGGKAEYRFKLTNLYQEEVHISSVRSSCGCTTAQILTERLASRQTGEILAKFNTKSFLGQKDATITVVIDQPYYAEVQLRVGGYIRSDVVFSPGEVNFPSAAVGQGSSTEIDITYAGREDWAIVDVRSKNKFLAVELAETERGNGRVGYRMTVKLKADAPAGIMRDQISIVTNDDNLTTVPLMVEANVRGAVVASPSLLSLGVIPPGQSVTKKVLVKGNEAFTIEGVRKANPALKVDVPADAKKMQFIPVTFSSNESGTVATDTIVVQTSLGPVEVKVTGQVQ